MWQLFFRTQTSSFCLVTFPHRVLPSYFTASFNTISNSMRSPRERNKQEVLTPLCNGASSSSLPTSTILYSTFAEDTFSLEGEKIKTEFFLLLVSVFILKTVYKWYSILRTHQYSEKLNQAPKIALTAFSGRSSSRISSWRGLRTAIWWEGLGVLSWSYSGGYFHFYTSEYI